mmetsp:Transcript_44604/g.127269  ORF Transcript_44604/g.127269 Transcript_44604/m.127269 type:complete len:93 (-) Transcript_44604:66-344(-)
MLSENAPGYTILRKSHNRSSDHIGTGSNDSSSDHTGTSSNDGSSDYTGTDSNDGSSYHAGSEIMRCDCAVAHASFRLRVLARSVQHAYIGLQ